MLPFLQVTFTAFGAMDPVGNVPFFLALTDGLSREERRRVARRAVFASAAMILVFVFAGRTVLEAFHVSMESFRISGGLVLALIGLQIIFEFGNSGQSPDRSLDVSLVPLATPLLAGPGIIALSIIMAKEYGYLITLSGMAVNLALVWLLFHYADLVYRWVGRSGMTATAKIMGIIIVAIGVEMMRKGLAG